MIHLPFRWFWEKARLFCLRSSMYQHQCTHKSYACVKMWAPTNYEASRILDAQYNSWLHEWINYPRRKIHFFWFVYRLILHTLWKRGFIPINLVVLVYMQWFKRWEVGIEAFWLISGMLFHIFWFDQIPFSQPAGSFQQIVWMFTTIETQVVLISNILYLFFPYNHPIGLVPNPQKVSSNFRRVPLLLWEGFIEPKVGETIWVLLPGRKIAWNLQTNHPFWNRNMIGTKPPWFYVPALNLPGVYTTLPQSPGVN